MNIINNINKKNVSIQEFKSLINLTTFLEIFDYTQYFINLIVSQTNKIKMRVCNN